MEANTIPPIVEKHAEFINSTVNSLYTIIAAIPGSHLALNYVKNAYQNDPFRIALELFLVFFAIRYLMSAKYKPHDNAVKLSDKEIDELVEEWHPEPLVPALNKFDKFNLDKTPVISGAQSAKSKVVGYAKPLMNLATTNYLNFTASEEIREKAITTLRNYGVGSCGPPGFYGTIDVHMELEKDIAHFIGTEAAIIYAQNFSTISSVIPAFSKRGDILVCDDSVSFAVQKGIQISRSIVRWYKHNDMADLERVLEEIRMDDLVHKKRLTRRFIVCEGLSTNYGDIAPLDKLIEIKKKYKYRLILDESQSFGVVGPRGAGLTDLFQIPATEVDIIVGSMANALCSSGGFCAGSVAIVDHQRLSGLAYCFSASIPAMLAVSSSEAIKLINEQPQLLAELAERTKTFRLTLTHKSLESFVELFSGDPENPAPFFHIRAKPSFLQSRLLEHEEEISREDEEYLWQDVVDECANQGVLVTRAKYVIDQERHCPRPGIKISVTIGLTKKENEKAAGIVKSAIIKVFTKWRK
ncbi:pyridoxal phosphate-dependent transferase [Cokeromyces recurvatus]|uniref:pyridoxal phosphate-dependent transferase n=1 Tax=Cokeromyces recurvatus TaxID=90255 RepID=UPI00221FBF6F|nr:pyridoxal phosphate-dependent transferase [Cokeromyces recurvatus]KAI7902791.1 pyridoxal phosphate-dependent transferase [Cokeromyces recurvatus]